MTWINQDTIVIEWSVGDVREQAKLKDIDLNNKQCRKVLEQCLKYHDASVGINWDIIDHHIFDLFGNKNNKKRKVA